MITSIACFKFKQGGGIERYTLDIVKGLHLRKINPKVYSTLFDKSMNEYQYITPIHYNSRFIPKKIKLPFFSKFIEKNRKHNEVIISMAYTHANIIVCGGQHKGYLNATKKRVSLTDKLKIYHEQKALNRAKIVIAHSLLMKKELIELYSLPENKIKVIYPPVDTEKFHIIDNNTRIKLREKFGFTSNDIIYLFPSTGHKRKGFEILKNFFESTNLPIKLVVAGTPVKNTKNIISLGFRKDMPELYQIADFTIMASIYEPFGLVGIESILSGTPVIFSQNMACLEVFKNNFGFTFDRENQLSLEKAIMKSFELAKSNQHRINDPLNTLMYDPRLYTHIDKLLKEIESL